MATIKIDKDKFYCIASAGGGMLEAENSLECGAAVYLGEGTVTDNRLWKFLQAGDGVYKLQNKASGKVLDIIMAGISDGSWLHMWDNVDAASQLWSLVPAGSAGVKLKSALSGKVLDLVGGEEKAEIGAQAQIWQDVNGKRQLWQVYEEIEQPKAEEPVKEQKAEKAAAPKKAKKQETVETAPAPVQEPVAKVEEAPKTEEKPPVKKPARKPAPKRSTAKKSTANKTTRSAAKKG